MNSLSKEDRSELLRLLTEGFNLSELKDLCFVLGVNHELFRHDTLSDLARELLLFCERRELVGCLLNEIRQRRPDRGDWLATILAKLLPCDKGQKVQVIVAETLLAQVQLLLDDLAQELGVPVEAITVVAAAWGSTRLLLSVPTAAMDFTRFKQISTLANGRYHVLSIEAFTFLPAATQATWQLIATTQPPLSTEDTLYATMGWQAAQTMINESQETTAISPAATPSTHWLSRADNQTDLLAISQDLVGQLSPGETERLNSVFPRYAQLAQTGQVKTVQQAQTAFGLGGTDPSLALLVLSVLFTAVNAWIVQKNQQTMTELKLQQENDRSLLHRLLDDALRQNRIPRQEREQLRPLLSEAIAKKVGDLYSVYEQGLEKLTGQVGPNLELLTYEQRLRENISQTRRYGDTPNRAAQRSEIIEQLNLFSLQMIGQSFNELC
jgi:hypothetical protein